MCHVTSLQTRFWTHGLCTWHCSSLQLPSAGEHSQADLGTDWESHLFIFY